MPETLTVEIVDTVSAIGAADWNGLVVQNDPHRNPFMDHAFLLALETSGSATPRTGWQPRHLVLKADGALRGVMPLYQKAHSQGEYVFDHGWADAFERAGGRYYPKLQSAVPFTPVTAPKLVAATDEHKRALLAGAVELAAMGSISSVHATFLPDDEIRLARADNWLIRTDTQYHWHNHGFGSFDDYLETMSSRHRKVTRRERRDAVAGLEVRWLTGPDLTETVWDQFFEFYQDTGSRKWGRPYLNRPFFSMLSEAMADRVVLMFAYDNDEPIAGTLSLLGADTLYGRYWGATQNVPFLHFELCYYQAIDFAIAKGLAKVEAGAQGEHKLARGYVPTATHSAHWIADPGFRDAVARFLRQEERAVEREQEALAAYAPFKQTD